MWLKRICPVPDSLSRWYGMETAACCMRDWNGAIEAMCNQNSRKSSFKTIVFSKFYLFILRFLSAGNPRLRQLFRAILSAVSDQFTFPLRPHLGCFSTNALGIDSRIREPQVGGRQRGKICTSAPYFVVMPQSPSPAALSHSVGLRVFFSCTCRDDQGL